ncbi:MAG: 2-C-methyl-D-erythritol 4-phosphate cytidylyltransferase [Deltaproteobacteria bacterium]|nr:2-C-methyl-D-erythritol 4-phosphate cytidylyltransferase [Deltaproteobacteria bacterium]
MAVGSILLADDADAVARPMLGAPVGIRALAATLLPRQEVHAVMVAPLPVHELLRKEADRFGLSELIDVLPSSLHAAEALAAALARLPADVDAVLVHDALVALCPTAMVLRVLNAARVSGAACPVLPLRGEIFVDGEELRTPQAGPLCLAQPPMAFTRTSLQKVVERAGTAGLAAAALEAGVTLARVEGDRDAFRVKDGADLTRALEVWGRRAPEFAFIWPRPSTREEEATIITPGPSELNVTIPERPA